MAVRTSGPGSSCCWGCVRVERVKEPTPPGALGLEKACQGDHGSTSILLLIFLSNLGYLIYSEDFPQDSSPRQSGWMGLPTHERQFGHKAGRREFLKSNGWFPLGRLEEVVLQWLDKMSEKPRAEKCNMSLRTLPLINTGREDSVLNKTGKLKAPLP